MPLLAVDGNEEPRLYQGVDDLQLLLAGVAGDMKTFALLVNHIGTLPVQLIDDPGDGFFVAGNGGGGDDDPVAGGHVYLLVGGECHPIQGRHILTLGAGGHDDQLIFRNGFDGIQVYDGSLLHLQIAQLLGNLQHIFHAPAGDSHLPAIPLGGGDHALDPVHIGGEGGDDDPLVAVSELPIQGFGHNIFAGGVALALHIGGIRQQSQNPIVAQLSQPGQVHHAISGGGVDLKVTGHNDGAHRGLNGESYGIGNGVVHMDEFYGEASGLHHIAGLVGNEFHRIGQVVLFQLQLDKAVGHGSAMDGTVDLLHAVGNGTDVVLMAVGNEHTPQLLLVGHQIRKVGDHQIHAVHIVIGETDTAVYHDHVLAVFQYGNVLADFVQST